MTRAESAVRYRGVLLHHLGLPIAAALSLTVLAGCGRMSDPIRAVASVISRDGELVRVPIGEGPGSSGAGSDGLGSDPAGQPRSLEARICRPAGDARAPVAIIAHGLPPQDESRADMSPASCGSPPGRFFNARGYVAVFALRRGYGGSGGDWAENPGACASPDYVRAGREGARDLDAILAFAVRLPFAAQAGAVIVGEDAGGWAVLGYAGQPHTIPASLVNLGGGLGARAANQLGHVCRPDLLADAAAVFGAASRTPTLWVYAMNDEVFPPAIAHAMHDAFVQAGGRAELVQPSGAGTDGHDLLFNDEGVPIWGGLVDTVLSPG